MTPLPLGSSVMRKILDRIAAASKREEEDLALKERHGAERVALEERQRFERECFERR